MQIPENSRTNKDSYKHTHTHIQERHPKKFDSALCERRLFHTDSNQLRLQLFLSIPSLAFSQSRQNRETSPLSSFFNPLLLGKLPRNVLKFHLSFLSFSWLFLPSENYHSKVTAWTSNISNSRSIIIMIYLITLQILWCNRQLNVFREHELITLCVETKDDYDYD